MSHDHPPIECVKSMIALARDGKIVSFDFWRHETHLQEWIIDVLDGPQPALASAECDQEMCQCLCELLTVLGCDPGMSSAEGIFTNAMLKLLLEMFMKWLVDMSESGQLVLIIQQLFQQAVDKL